MSTRPNRNGARVSVQRRRGAALTAPPADPCNRKGRRALLSPGDVPKIGGALANGKQATSSFPGCKVYLGAIMAIMLLLVTVFMSPGINVRKWDWAGERGRGGFAAVGVPLNNAGMCCSGCAVKKAVRIGYGICDALHTGSDLMMDQQCAAAVCPLRSVGDSHNARKSCVSTRCRRAPALSTYLFLARGAISARTTRGAARTHSHGSCVRPRYHHAPYPVARTLYCTLLPVQSEKPGANFPEPRSRNLAPPPKDCHQNQGATRA